MEPWKIHDEERPKRLSYEQCKELLQEFDHKTGLMVPATDYNREFMQEVDRETGLVDAVGRVLGIWIEGKIGGREWGRVMELLAKRWKKYGHFWNSSAEVHAKCREEFERFKRNEIEETRANV